MNKILSSLSLTFFLAVVFQNLYAGNCNCLSKNKNGHFSLAERVTDADYVHNVIIVKVKPEYRSACSNKSIQMDALQKTFSDIQVTTLEKLFPNHTPPASQRNSNGDELIDLSLIYKLNYTGTISIEKAIDALMATGRFLYAEPSYIYKPAYLPNDTSIALQYHLTNIQAFQAWDITKGDSTLKIGITDTGFDTLHPELINRIAHNMADTIDGIDNDGNGYVDDYSGWNVAFNNNASQGVNPYHGTFVAGVACAETDNITIGAGVGFYTKFLPVACCPGGNVIVNGELAIVYCADNGCLAVNCSWGGFGGSQFGQDVVDYATFNKNCLVVGAAGNSFSEAPFYPASYQHALSVAGTNATDNKWGGSSYGCGVDISAPGELIKSIQQFSTLLIQSSGTSEATPQVTAAAALVKAQYPGLSGIQIGERLRITADVIDTMASNATYFHKLGYGRLNVFNAVSATPAKSVRAYDFKITDNNDDAFLGTDTLRISSVFNNYLDPVSNLTVTLTCSSPYITILNNTFNAGAISTLGTDSNRTSPFTAVISGSAPPNSVVYFTLNYSDGIYTDWQCFNLFVNVDYINIFINEVGTSMTSRGRWGFNDDGQAQGIGFIFHQDPTLLYAGGLVIGVNDSMVSSEVVNAGGSIDDDFVPTVQVHAITPPYVSDFDAVTEFTDAAATLPMGIKVTHHAYAWVNAPDSRYIIYDFWVKNNSANNYNALYVGMYGDYDIPPAFYDQDSAGWDAARKMGWATYNPNDSVYAGIKVLTPGGTNYYAFNNDGSGSSVSIYNGFTKAEKYQTMSSLSRLSAGTQDISMMVSNGPFVCNAGDSIHAAFLLLAGDSLTDLQNSADAGQIKFDNIGVGVNTVMQGETNFTVYPNPLQSTSIISLTLATNSSVKIDLLDITGKEIKNLLDRKLNQGLHQFSINAGKLAAGVYLCRMETSGQQFIKKVIVK